MPITLNGDTGITTPGLINTGAETVVNLTTSGNTILGDASTDTLNVGNGGLVKDASGNVGIGTASPAYKLDVVGSARFYSASGASPYAYWWSGGGYRLAINMTDGASGVAIYNTLDNNAHTWQANSSEKMRLSASGGLSIGTTTDAGGYTILLGNASYANTPNFNALNSSGQSSFGTQGTTAYGALAAGDAYVYTAKHVVLVSDSASGAIKFATGAGAGEKMRLDASGNLGLGVTPSAWGYTALQVKNGAIYQHSATDFRVTQNAYLAAGNSPTYISTNAASMYRQESGTHQWYSAPSGTAGAGISWTNPMTLDASGVKINASFGGSTFPFRVGYTTGGTYYPKMIMDDSGRLGVGTTPVYTGHFVNTANTAAASFGIMAEAATVTNQYGLYIQLAGDPNNTTNYFFSFLGSYTTRAVLRSNGGLANFSANNVNLSDERVKKDIVNAGNYLDKICAIPVRTFLYKDQTDDELNLGVIAQEVEAVAPELVDLSGFGETPEDGVPLKAIYQTDLQYALMKCIQELKAELDITKAKVAALEAA